MWGLTLLVQICEKSRFGKEQQKGLRLQHSLWPAQPSWAKQLAQEASLPDSSQALLFSADHPFSTGTNVLLMVNKNDRTEPVTGAKLNTYLPCKVWSTAANFEFWLVVECYKVEWTTNEFPLRNTNPLAPWLWLSPICPASLSSPGQLHSHPGL